MTNLQFDRAKWSQDSEGFWLSLRVKFPALAKKFMESIKDRLYVAEIKEYREKRSLDANSYCWVLIGKIADVLRTDKDSVYFTMLKAYGQGGAVSVQDKFVPDFKRAWKYHESIGESELNEKHFEHFRFWVGSHLYDTREMSILIDGIVSECKALEIDAATPEELERMKGAWNDKTNEST